MKYAKFVGLFVLVVLGLIFLPNALSFASNSPLDGVYHQAFTAADILYDQSSPLSGSYIPAQKLEATYAQYDSQLADDFVVPAGAASKGYG